MKKKWRLTDVISAKVTTESAEGWRAFCASNGISISALIEIAGIELAAETSPPTSKARQRMVELAREVDQKRRSRKSSATNDKQVANSVASIN